MLIEANALREKHFQFKVQEKMSCSSGVTEFGDNMAKNVRKSYSYGIAALLKIIWLDNLHRLDLRASKIRQRSGTSAQLQTNFIEGNFLLFCHSTVQEGL